MVGSESGMVHAGDGWRVFYLEMRSDLCTLTHTLRLLNTHPTLMDESSAN